MARNAKRYRLRIEQGCTLERVFEVKDESGAPVDLSAKSARMQVRTSFDAPAPALAATTENGRLSIDPVAGSITLNVEAAATAALSGVGVFDLELVEGDQVERVVEGPVFVDPRVTR